MQRRILRTLVPAAVLASVLAGSLACARRPRPGPCPQPRPDCACTMQHAPVTCAGGCTYSNACVAACAGATGCVPDGTGPAPVP